VVSLDEAYTPCYFKGGRGNPVDRDGKKMLCSICSSPDHFRAKCPKGGGKGKGFAKGPPSFWSMPTSSPSYQTAAGSSEVPQPAAPASSEAQSSPGWYGNSFAQTGRVNYFFDVTMTASAPTAVEPDSIIHFMDGSAPLVLRPRNQARLDLFDLQPSTMPSSSGSATLQDLAHHPTIYAVLPASHGHQQVYHASVRIEGQESLVLDTGAVGNLSGENTLRRMIALAKDNGQGSLVETLATRMPVDGVGAGSSTCSHSAKVPVCLADGLGATYAAPMIDGSDVPALLGASSMTEHRFVLDLVHDVAMLLGPGGMELKLSPGSRVLPIQRSPTGHLLISASEWNKSKPSSATIALPVLPSDSGPKPL
jgi:hypothetical protein